ncbi:MAG: Gfo/Idh/MocA family protein [Candidatus Latescibacterota bacterium]
MHTVGIIGTGYWGKNLVRTFAGLESVQLKYISDSSQEILTSVAKNYPQITATKNYQIILDDSSVEAVVIAAPAAKHFQLAKDALNRGKHVFVEKPMTLEVQHSRELVELAEEKGLKLMVGHLLLYHPCITEIREYITRGDIGKVFYIYSQRLNLGKVRSDENALLSFAPHDISVILHLLDAHPVSVTAGGRSYLQPGIEDVVFLNIFFENQVMAHVHVSWLDPHKVRRITVVGSKKMVVFDDMEPQEKVKIYDKGVDRSSDYGSYGEFLSLRNGDIHIPDIKMLEPLRLECEHFIDCIEHDKTPVSDGRNGLLVTQVLDAGHRSLRSGGIPVEVK